MKKFKKYIKQNQFIVWFISLGVALNMGVLMAISMAKPASQTEKNYPISQIISQGDSHAFSYDFRTKNPSWALDVLKRGEELHTITSSLIDFISDTNIPENIRPILMDFENSGFTLSPLLMYSLSPYPISAASPQNTELLNGQWRKLNNYVLDRFIKLNVDRMLVISAPLFLDHDGATQQVKYDEIGKNEIAVPTHFYRALFYLSNPHESIFEEVLRDDPTGSTIGALPIQPQLKVLGEIYLIPNKAINTSVPLETFKIGFEEWSKIAGIVFPLNNIRFFLGNAQ